LQLGEKLQMWLKQLKIAVIEQDTQKLETLLENIPTLSDPKEIEEVLYLFEEVKKLLLSKQNELQISMKKMRKHKEFLTSSTKSKTAHFNITT